MAAKMIGCILVLCVAGSLAGPISWDAGSSTCATECPESVKFAYKSNNEYEYTYENDIQTSIPGSTEEQSSLHMRATVLIEVMSPCEMNLKLTDVSLQDSQPLQYESRQHVDNAWEFKRLLQEKGFRFGFIDGRIEHVCPDDEPVWVQNVKRGVLSAFQNTQTTLDAATKGRETDVSGECPVEYSLAGKSWSVKKVKKVKDMLGCTERHGADTSFTGSPYEIDSGIKSLPLLKTSHECDQEINNDGILIQSTCRERHVFRPFSDGDGGAQTEVNYKLTFVKKTEGSQTPATSVRQRSSLLFDHTLSEEEEEAQLTTATDTMRALCRSLKDEDVRPETPSLFADLVRAMRTLDAQALNRLQTNAGSLCPQAEKYYRDAIPNIGTAASLSVIQSLIQQGRVEESEAALWLTHLAFVPQPSRSMLSAVQPLLKSSGVIQRKAALAISSMVHNYCKLNTECANTREVREIIQIFEDNLSYNCKSDGDITKHETILMALKALGNTGNAQQASQALVRCFQNEQEPMEVRVAAINAFRRMSCSAERMDLMRLFGDKEQDSELRIEAYLMLMNCPNEDIVTQIQQILSEEEVNQVGSFVYTHLTNLMESSDPSKRELREILQSIDLKVFDLDMRKFSRNIEWSLFSDMMNTGAKAESNMIFSTQSFVPRSGMLNITVDMFGHSVNLFEIGGRVEGFDKLLESIFRKDDNSLRQKRDVIRPSLLNYVDNQFKVAEDDGLKASYFLKIFGNEIHYNDLHDLDLGEVKDRMNFLDWLVKLSKEQQMDYTKSYMFLDSELVVPTAVGMPLKLAIDGTATVNVKLDGKVDVMQIMSNPSNFDINGAIKPSAAVEICSEMVVDGFVAKTGLKMVSTVHTSTVTQGKLSLLDGKVFHFDLEMPREKQEIFNTQTKFFVMYRGEQREQQMIGQGRSVEKDCYDLSNALGIEVCGEMSLPMLAKDQVAKFPLTGPSSAAVYINKKDTFSKYHLEGSYEMDKRSRETEFKLNINTPGSKVDREIDIFFNMNPAQKTVALNLKSPWKKAVMTGEVTNTPSLKRVSAKATIDDRREYSFVSEVAIDAKKFGTSYNPKVELIMHNARPKTLMGQIFYRDNKKFEIDMALTNVFEEPVTCDGSVLKVDNAKRMKYDVDLNVTSTAFKGKVDGFVDHQGDTISSRVVLAYKNAKNKNEKVVFSNKIRDKSTKTLTSYSLDTALTTTFWPRYNTDVSLDYTYGRNTLSTTLDAGFDPQRRIKMSNSANFQSSRQEIRMDGMMRLEVPYKGLEYELSVNHLHDDNVFNSNATLQYHGQTAQARIDAKRESTDPVNAYAKAFLTYPGREMSIEHTINEKKPSEFHNDFVAQLDKYTKATANVVLKMKPRYDVTANINLPSMKPIDIEGHYKPDLFNFQLGASGEYDNRKYYTTVEWSAPKTLQRDFKSNHSVKFGCPYRSMELTGQLSQRGPVVAGEHEFKWDVERSPEKKVNTEWSVTLIPTKPKVMATASWYPNKFVKMEAEGAYEQEGWYRTSNDLQGSIKLTSSFPHLQNINADLKHDYGHDAITSSGQVTWASGQKINADFKFNKNTWNQLDTSLTVATPFPGFRTMKMLTNYKLQRNNLESMAAVQWEQQEIKLEAKGSADLGRHMVEGEASFSSPFQRFQAISISGKHNDDGRNFNSNMDFSWAPNQKVTATLTMEHQMSGLSINNNGELVVTTPFRGYRQNKMTWTHMNKDNSVTTRFDTNNDGVTNMISLDGSLDNSPRKTQLTGNFMLDTPYASDVQVKINHVHNKKGIDSDALVQWAPKQVIKYVQNIQYDAYKSLEVAAKVTTPFRQYREVTLESKTTKSGGKINTLNEFKWNPNSKINADGTFTLLGGPKFTSNLRVSTPFDRYERTVMNVNNDFADALWLTHADLDVARRHYEIDTKVGIDRRKKITIDTSKMEYGFMIDAEHSGHARDFTTLLSGKIPKLNENPLGAELKVNTADLNNIKSTFTLNTPWRQAQTVKATLGHRQPSSGSYMTDASFEMPSYKGSASHTMNINRWSNFDSQSTVEYQNKKIELTTEMKDRPNMEGKITFTSPFCEPVTLVANHEGNLKKFKTGMDLTYRNTEKISGDVDFMANGNNLKASARFVSPLTERVVVTANHRGAWKNFENDASVEVGRQRLAATSKFSLNGANLETSGSLDLPLRKVRNIQVSLKHDGVWKNFASNAMVEIDGQKMNGDYKFNLNGNNLKTSANLEIPCWVRVIKAEYNHDGPINNFKCNSALTVGDKTGTHSMEFKNAKVMTGKAEINTPFPAARLLKAEFKHDAKKWNSFENDGKFTWNNKEYSGDSELRWYGDTLRVIGNLKTPADSYALKIKHKGDRKQFTNSAVVDLSSGQKYSAESGFKNQPTSMEGNFNIQTPHQSFNKMSGQFSQSSDRKGFEANAQLKTPFKGYEKFSGDVNHSGNMNNFQSTATIETPFRKLPSATFAVTHQGDRDEFACTAEAKYGRKTINGAANYKNTARSMEGSASLNTPYSGYEKFEGSFSHSGSPRNFKSHVEIKTPFAGHDMYSAKVEHAGARLENFKTMAAVNTPFSGFENTAFTINHNGDLTGMTTDATLETSMPGYDKFNFNVNHNGDPKNIRTMVQVKTPFRGFDDVAINVNHKGDAENFESGAELKGMQRTVGYNVKHNGNLNNFRTEANVNLPIRGMENWGVTVNHNGNLAQFTCSAVITMPFSRVPELKLDVNHRGNLMDFASGVSAEWNGRKVDTQGEWKYEKSYYVKNYQGGLKFTSPWQNLDVSGQHKREGETKIGNLLVTHNAVQKVKLDYTYTTGANKNIRVTFTEPKIFEVLVNFEGTGPSFKSDASFEWERKTNVKVELDLKNQISGDSVDRQVTFKTTMPRRVIGFDVAFLRTPEKMSQTTELQWDRDEASKLNYALELTSNNYRRRSYDGSFKFDSAMVDFQTTFSHMMPSELQSTTTVTLTMDETLTIKREATFHDNGMLIVFTTSHPRFSRDAILKVDANMGDKVTEGEIDLQFEREAINFRGKIADEAVSASEMKYTAMSHLTYPNMRLDMKYDGSMYNNQRGCGGDMEFNYLTSRDGMKKMTSTVTYDKQSRKAEYEMNTPMTTLKLTGTETIHDSYNGIHRFEIVAEKDNKAVRTEFGLDMSGRKIEAKFYTPRDEMLHIYAQYMRPAVEFKVYRQLANGDSENDIHLNLNLDSDELVSGTAYIRPDISSDIKALYNNPRFQAKINREFEPVKRVLMQEWEAKKSAWERVSERPQAAFNAIYDDMSTVASKVNRAGYRAYQANEFHLKDIYDAVAAACNDVNNYVQYCVNQVAPKFEEMRRNMVQGIRELRTCMEEYSVKMNQMYQKMIEKATAIHAEYKPHMVRAVKKVQATYKQAKDHVVGAYNAVINHPRVSQMMQAVQDMQPSDVFAPLRKLKYRMSTAIDKWHEEHQEVFQALEDLWNNIAQRQEIRDLAIFLEQTLGKMQRFWERYDVQKSIKVWLKNLSKANWKNLKQQAMDAFNEYFQLDKTRWTTYDPNNGNYGFELYVPYDLKDVTLPKFNVMNFIRQAQRILDDLSFDEEWCMWDTIYKYMPSSLNFRDWIPPFKAHATFAGDQHFMTFDKKFYEFSGECSYLLARDFIDGYFSVIANYQSQGGKKSITVFSNDKQVELSPGGQITMNGRPAEMPLEVEGTIIKRLSNMVYIKNPHGVSIECDLVHYRCTVSVSGWYFGKTGGLLGTYDNEPITDLMKADNSMASTVEEMAESWIIGSRCRATNYANIARVEPETRSFKLCAKYFKDTDSPFRPCFKQVDPEPFMTMCLNDMSSNSNRLESDEDTCNVASYYVKECKMNSASIRLPRLCVTCDLPSGGQMIEGDNMTLTEVPNSADVVFVVQHGDCNREVMTKMNDILSYFERTFDSAQMTDVHYGIVGFGGQGALSEPSTHTIRGQVMSTNVRDVMGSMNALTYDGPSPADADVMSAVRFAAMYPFRMGVSKSVIVLPCASSREGATRYTELQRILIERDVRLHLLMEHTFTLKGTKSASPKSGLMFGMDKNGLFIDKHVSDNELLGDAALRNQVTQPKDLCAALSDVTDGTVFARDMLATQRTSVQKSFVDVFVRLVVKKAKPSECQMCECVADKAMAGQPICHHCDMNPIYNMRPMFDEYDYEDESSEESMESKESEEQGRPVRRPGRKNRDQTVRRRKERRQ